MTKPKPTVDDTRSCTLHDCGNGLPAVGDYVASSDGEVYIVVEIGRIQFGERAGEGDWMPGRVRPADWADVGEGDEPVVRCELGE